MSISHFSTFGLNKLNFLCCEHCTMSHIFDIVWTCISGKSLETSLRWRRTEIGFASKLLIFWWHSWVCALDCFFSACLTTWQSHGVGMGVCPFLQVTLIQRWVLNAAACTLSYANSRIFIITFSSCFVWECLHAPEVGQICLGIVMEVKKCSHWPYSFVGLWLHTSGW